MALVRSLDGRFFDVPDDILLSRELMADVPTAVVADGDGDGGDEPGPYCSGGTWRNSSWRNWRNWRNGY